jgi:hypothetical protein
MTARAAAGRRSGLPSRHSTLLLRSATARARVDSMQVERYKYILQQLHTLNENVYKLLAVYQTLATALVGAGLALFVGYKKWNIDAGTARAGIHSLLWLITTVAMLPMLLIVMGILNWIDYRREECELTDETVYSGFRRPPQVRNLFRWYETYIVLFIASSMVFMWVYAYTLILPAMH